MAKLFGYDNPIWKIMGKVADMFLLTIIWALFSLPIVTVGASTCALYYVALKLSENKEGYLFRSFLKAFKEGVAQSTFIWIIMMVVGGGMGTLIFMCWKSGTQLSLMILWALLIFALVYVLMMTVIFALTARLSTGIPNLFLMSFMICVKNFSWVLLMAVLTVCIMAMSIFVFWPLLLFAPGAISFLHAKILQNIIFPKYNWNRDTEEIAKESKKAE